MFCIDWSGGWSIVELSLGRLLIVRQNLEANSELEVSFENEYFENE